MKPRVCILKTDGTNCDEETAFAYAAAGAQVKTVLMNQLRKCPENLNNFQILVIPGGFSYGDDVASGKILALEMLSFLRDQLAEFIQKDTLILGICNGFQVLARTGLLPLRQLDSLDVTLAANDSGTFECRWISLIVEKSPCIFTHGLEKQEIMLPIAHGEGKLFAHTAILEHIEQHNLIPLRYSDNQTPTQKYPANPNGSLHAIAGLCDATGRIFGLMPHPERFILSRQGQNWRRSGGQPYGLSFFKNSVSYFS